MLSTLLSVNIESEEKKRVLKDKYGIAMSVELEREVSSMCNLSEAIEENGIEKGKTIAIYELVQSKDIIPKVGAEKLGISIEQLKNDMEIAGFTFSN